MFDKNVYYKNYYQNNKIKILKQMRNYRENKQPFLAIKSYFRYHTHYKFYRRKTTKAITTKIEYLNITIFKLEEINKLLKSSKRPTTFDTLQYRKDYYIKNKEKRKEYERKKRQSYIRKENLWVAPITITRTQNVIEFK